MLFEAPAPASTSLPSEFVPRAELREVAIAQLEARLRREQPDITDAQVREGVRASGSRRATPGWGTPRPAESEWP